MSSQFRSCCPRCASPDHAAYHLRVGGMDLGAPYGEALRHCAGCGLKFHARKAVELRELAPVEPPLKPAEPPPLSPREWERWTL